MNFYDKVAERIATMGGVGKIPFAPGTFGSFGGIVFFYLTSGLSVCPETASLFFLICIAVFSAHRAAKLMGQKDPAEIVIDEVAGMAVTCAGLPFSLPVAVSGFVLFRLFDILKPFPVIWFDRRFSGGFGIVMDDVCAGLICRLILGILV